MNKNIQQLVSKKSIKIAVYLYSIWFVLNLYILSYSLSHLRRYQLLMDTAVYNAVDNYPMRLKRLRLYADIDLFFPFQSSSLETYYISEFVLYVFVIPVVIFFIVRLFITIGKLLSH